MADGQGPTKIATGVGNPRKAVGHAYVRPSPLGGVRNKARRCDLRDFSAREALGRLGDEVGVLGGEVGLLGGVGGKVVQLPRRIGVLGEAALDGFPIAHQDGPLAAVAGEIPCDGRARRLSYAAQGGREGFALAGELRYST